MTVCVWDPCGGGGSRRRRFRSRSAQPRSRCKACGRPATKPEAESKRTESGRRPPGDPSCRGSAAAQQHADRANCCGGFLSIWMRLPSMRAHKVTKTPLPSMKVAGLSSVLVDCPGLQSPSAEVQTTCCTARYADIACARPSLSGAAVDAGLASRTLPKGLSASSTVMRKAKILAMALARSQAFWCSAFAKPASPCFCFNMST